jgi:hypothetical protein
MRTGSPATLRLVLRLVSRVSSINKEYTRGGATVYEFLNLNHICDKCTNDKGGERAENRVQRGSSKSNNKDEGRRTKERKKKGKGN